MVIRKKRSILKIKENKELDSKSELKDLSLEESLKDKSQASISRNRSKNSEVIDQEAFLNLENDEERKEDSKEVEDGNQSIVSILNGLES